MRTRHFLQPGTYRLIQLNMACHYNIQLSLNSIAVQLLCSDSADVQMTEKLDGIAMNIYSTCRCILTMGSYSSAETETNISVELKATFPRFTKCVAGPTDYEVVVRAMRDTFIGPQLFRTLDKRGCCLMGGQDMPLNRRVKLRKCRTGCENAAINR